MKRIIITLLLTFIIFGSFQPAQASLISNYKYRHEQIRDTKQDIKAIKDLFKKQLTAANNHDSTALEALYNDKFMNNDGFNKEVYFKSIKSTWEACSDLSYSTKLLSISVNGDYATVDVEETATGTVVEKYDYMQISGEIHSLSESLYHLEKVNGQWYITGETAISDESSLLYGDARFMNIDLQVPAQVSAGEAYTSTLKIDADEDTFILGSIDHDLVTYPANVPKNDLRAIPRSQTLERIIKANTDNINEYSVASLAISKVTPLGEENVRIRMVGLACIMKRINVVPKNNFINPED